MLYKLRILQNSIKLNLKRIRPKKEEIE